MAAIDNSKQVGTGKTWRPSSTELTTTADMERATQAGVPHSRWHDTPAALQSVSIPLGVTANGATETSPGWLAPVDGTLYSVQADCQAAASTATADVTKNGSSVLSGTMNIAATPSVPIVSTPEASPAVFSAGDRFNFVVTAGAGDCKGAICTLWWMPK